MSGQSILAIGVLVGLFVPPVSDFAGPALPVTVFLFVLGTFLRADLPALKLSLSNPQTSLVLPVTTVILLPVSVGIGLNLTSLPKPVVAGVVLALASPPSSGNAALARMFGYKGEVPLTIILVTTCLTPVTMPLVASTIGIDIDPMGLLLGLSKLLITAGTLALILRFFFGAFVSRNSVWIDRSVLYSLFVFAIATMQGVLGEIRNDVGFAASILLAAFLTNALQQAIGYTIGRSSGHERIALAMTFGNRNVGLAWAALGTTLNPAVTLFFALAQLPIFVLPWVWKLFYRSD